MALSFPGSSAARCLAAHCMRRPRFVARGSWLVDRGRRSARARRACEGTRSLAVAGQGRTVQCSAAQSAAGEAGEAGEGSMENGVSVRGWVAASHGRVSSRLVWSKWSKWSEWSGIRRVSVPRPRRKKRPTGGRKRKMQGEILCTRVRGAAVAAVTAGTAAGAGQLQLCRQAGVGGAGAGRFKYLKEPTFHYLGTAVLTCPAYCRVAEHMHAPGRLTRETYSPPDHGLYRLSQSTS